MGSAIGEGMAKRIEKVTQQTWQKSYELDGELNVSTLTITPVLSGIHCHDCRISVTHTVAGRKIRSESDSYVETAEQVAARRAGLQSGGYSMIGERSVALRAA